MRRKASRLGIVAAVALVLGVLIAACSGGSGAPGKKSAGGSSTSTRPSAPSPSRPLLTVRDNAVANAGPQPYRLDIYDLRRDGPFLVLDFGLTCLNPPSTGCDGGIAFTGPKLGPGSAVHDVRVPSGVWLVDPAGDQEYRPVSDAQHRPFTSQLQQVFLDSATHLEWARYAAPPPGVRSLDVVFPNGGPQVPSVPITSGPGPVPSAREHAAQPAPFAIAAGSMSTAGLDMGVESLLRTVGSGAGSDTESATQASVSLHADVLFHFDKSNLTPAAHSILTAVARQIKARATGSVAVTGYTDSIGTDAVNIPLSQRRAQAVVAALTPLTSGIAYTAAGRGSADPVAPNTEANGADNPTGRALNRRVTIVYKVKAPARPTPPPSPPAGAPAGAEQGQSVAFTVGGATGFAHTWRATPTALFREGNLLVLRMTLACVGAQSGEDFCDLETDLAGLPTVPPSSLSDISSSYTIPFFTFSAFSMLDPATRSQYIPLHTADEYPLTGRIEVPTVNVGSTYQAWAYFPAPPSSVTSINLVAPGGTQLAGVPIGSGPPP